MPLCRGLSERSVSYPTWCPSAPAVAALDAVPGGARELAPGGTPEAVPRGADELAPGRTLQAVPGGADVVPRRTEPAPRGAVETAPGGARVVPGGAEAVPHGAGLLAVGGGDRRELTIGSDLLGEVVAERLDAAGCGSVHVEDREGLDALRVADPGGVRAVDGRDVGQGRHAHGSPFFPYVGQSGCSLMWPT